MYKVVAAVAATYWNKSLNPLRSLYVFVYMYGYCLMLSNPDYSVSILIDVPSPE